jgi:hypothetical protein
MLHDLFLFISLKNHTGCYQSLDQYLIITLLNTTEADMSEEALNELREKLEADLLKLYGSPILNLEQLHKALNYRSVATMRQALLRGTLPIPIFSQPHRRGYFVLVAEVAKYMAQCAVVNMEAKKM